MKKIKTERIVELSQQFRNNSDWISTNEEFIALMGRTATMQDDDRHESLMLNSFTKTLFVMAQLSMCFKKDILQEWYTRHNLPYSAI